MCIIRSALPGNRLDLTFCPGLRTERQRGQDLWLFVAFAAPTRRRDDARIGDRESLIRDPRNAAARRRAATRAATKTAIEALYMEEALSS